MLKRGYGCALTSERVELQLGEDFKHTHSSRRTLRLSETTRTHSRHGDCHSISVLSYQDLPLRMIAPSYTMKRTSGTTADYWEFFKDRGILRRVSKRRRALLFVREQRMLPSGISLDDLAGERRTVVQLPSGELRELQDLLLVRESDKGSS